MITSPQNPRIKLVRGLQRRAKLRRQEQRLVLEGARLLRDAVEAGVQPDFVCYTAENDAPADPDLVARLESAGIACLPVADALMREMADTDTPQGILGVVPWPDLPIPTAPDLVIVADGWRDPGNVGTLLRTAAAAGVDLVVLLPGTVDPFNPKTLRAGMGAHFRVPVLATHWPDLLDRFPDRAVYVAEMGGQTPYYAVDWTRPSLIVIGGEAHGTGPAVQAADTTPVHIPMVAGAESLNAAVAASLLIYEARRHTWQ